MRNTLTKLFARNIDADALLELFLVSAVSSVLIIRGYLALTGYPKIGTGDYHIAHMLWGGFLMVISIFILLVFLNKESKKLAAFLGGIGFGAFIDELGKFITSDNDYFYQPTIALIYVIFVCIYLGIHSVKRRKGISARDYAINALEVTKEVIFFDLDKFERKKAISYLKKSDLTNPAVESLLTMLQSFKQLKASKKGLTTQFKEFLLLSYFYLVQKKWFSFALISFFVFFAVYRMLKVLISIRQTPSFAQWGEMIFSVVSAFFILIGINYIRRRKRLSGYIMFKHAVLVSIFLTQFFLFLRAQLSAMTAFIFSLVVYATLHYLIDQEKKLQKTPAGKALHKLGNS